MEKATQPYEAAPEAAALPISFADLFQEKIFEANYLREPLWLQDSRRFSYLENLPESEQTGIYIYDVQDGSRKPLAFPPKLGQYAPDVPEKKSGEANEKPDTLPIHGYQWSPDEKKILFARSPRRRSSEADPALYVFELATSHFQRITPPGKSYRNAKWSPGGDKIGYVRDDDLCYLDLATGKEVRLTDSAAPHIYNGRFGWVYEEELDLVDGWAWSPDGKHVAYFQQDENPVPQVPLADYDDLHLRPRETRYPKAGDPNPIVKIGIVPVPAPNAEAVHATRWVDLGADTDIYIARMQWTPQGDLLLQRIPRLQNRLDLLKVNAKSLAVKVLLTEESKTWVDSPGDVTFIKGTNQFLWPSDRSGYTHLYLYDLNGKELRQLTQGDWDVDRIAGIDATHRMAFFTAARPNPMERHIFNVLLDGGGDVVQLSETAGMHSPHFSHDGSHYLDAHSSRSVAPLTRLHRAGGQEAAVVHENPMPKLQGRRLSGWEFLSFKTSDGVTLNAALLKPANFDAAKPHPVLMYTYGGPGSQVVQDQWGGGGGWYQMLAQKGYIIAMVDGRGSGGRGSAFEKITYRNLGHWEVNDQIEGAKWLGTLPFVDPKRIGIWGWSYGGYMAAMSIVRGAEVFKAAVAVAAVTHWQFYDSIYTERYMCRPQDNPKGYEESTPLTYADKLTGKFLLIHGTADDNVHFQNAARLAEEFQKKGRQFRTMYYPGKHHGLEGVSEHLYPMMTDFILENL